MFSRTKALAIALLTGISAGLSHHDKVRLEAKHPGSVLAGLNRNPQGIDLFYLSKSYRSNSKYQPHEGTRQAGRFQRNYTSDGNGVIRPISRHEKKLMAATFG